MRLISKSYISQLSITLKLVTKTYDLDPELSRQAYEAPSEENEMHRGKHS